jgi:hypothetical protein
MKKSKVYIVMYTGYEGDKIIKIFRSATRAIRYMIKKGYFTNLDYELVSYYLF